MPRWRQVTGRSIARIALPHRAFGRAVMQRRGLDNPLPDVSLAATKQGEGQQDREDSMKLSQQQIDDFNREGWLFLPELFTQEETSFLAHEAEGIYAANRPEVWREKSGAPRTAFAAHLYNEAFRLLGAHPRMIEPVEQLFGERVYMHQFKINAKSAFTGDVWQWHQDYGTWKRDDGMPEPRAMNIAIFLDEVMPINGPLMLVPQSQDAGDLKASHDLATTSYPLWTLDEETVTRLVRQGGIVAPTGKPGGMLMFHGNLVHGSSGNITPYPRKIVYLTLNAVSNYIRTPTRPDYIAHRDFRPIETVEDDALLRLARAQRQAAE
jgi:ectoine hydroxylase